MVGAYVKNSSHVLCAYGSNRSLQLGSPSANPDFDHKTWPIEEPVVTLKSGRAHTLGLTSSGRLFVWGSNNFGQLGSLRDVQTREFTFLEFPDIVGIAAGLDNSFLLTQDGTVLACGWSADGQTGSGGTTILDRFTEVRVPHPVARISCSADSTLVMCENGKVYGWGNNEYNQISPSPEMQIVSPTEVPLPGAVRDIAAGGSFSLFLLESGEIVSCGYGPGTGREQDLVIASPAKIPNSPALTSVSASLDHAAGLTEDGRMYIWGCGQHDKLLSDSGEHVVTPQLVEGLKERVMWVACGSVRTVVVTETAIKSVSRLGMIEPAEGEEEEEDPGWSR